MRAIERSAWQGRALTLTWEAGKFVPAGRVTQASGLCFTDDGSIVLVSEDGRSWNLPGGHPEGGETPEQALRREVLEEACAVAEACVYLGAQRVDDPGEPSPYFQTRFWARVKLLPFEPRHETKYRKLVPPEEFLETLEWGHTNIAQALLEAALATERDLRSAHHITSHPNARY